MTLFKRVSIVAASVFALSGCVSSASPDLMSAAEPLPANQVANNAPDGEQAAGTAIAAGAEGQTADPSTAENDGQAPPGDASQLASLTMQSTGVNASSGSIFAVRNADGSAAPATVVTDGDGETHAVPAYVPVPGVNPSLRSLYQGGSQTPGEGAQQMGVQPENAPDLVAQAAAADGQGSQPDNAQQTALVADSGTQQPATEVALAGTQTQPGAAAAMPEATSDQRRALGELAANAGEPKAEPRKKTLADFFGGRKKKEADFDGDRFAGPVVKKTITPENMQPVRTASLGGNALPGVVVNAMFATGDDLSQTENPEDDIETPVEIAALPGLARLASNGFWMQTEKVDAGCFKPELMKVLGRIEAHYGRKLMVTSGYREPRGNRERQSLHTTCSAADIQIDGVEKWELAAFLRTMPERGGVGTYCHTNSVHIDVGQPRDWNWRCRRRK